MDTTQCSETAQTRHVLVLSRQLAWPMSNLDLVEDVVADRRFDLSGAAIIRLLKSQTSI